MKEILQLFPVVIDCSQNGDIIGKAISDRNVNFLDRGQVERLVTDLTAPGSLYLNPAALGPEYEARYGDELCPGNQNITAADLKKFTTPNRPQSEQQREARVSADEYWAAHPELAGERFKRERGIGDAEALRRAKAEVTRFLTSHAGAQYLPDDTNRDLMLDYLREHKLDMTAESLTIAFDALRDKLKKSDVVQTSGATTVYDFGERNENPSYISTDLRDNIRRKIARFNSGEYQEWLVSHPEEAALLDE